MVNKPASKQKIQTARETPLDNSSNDFDSNNVKSGLEEIDFRQETLEPTGFKDRTTSTISFDEGTRTFTISPVGDEFNYWIRGHQYTKTSSESIQISDTYGLWFIYYSGDTLTSSQTPWNFSSPIAFVAFILWSSSDSEALIFGDERHGLTMDWATHQRWHNTIGPAKKLHTFDLINYTIQGNGTLDIQAQVGLEDGDLYDEDLIHHIIHSNTPTNEYEQYLRDYAKIPLYYKSGSGNGEWHKLDATNFPVVYDGINPIKYNKYDSGTDTWSLVNCENNSYMVIWVFATHNIYEPILGVVGRVNSESFVDAVGEDLENITEGLSWPENLFLYKLVYRTQTNYTNTPKAVLYGFYNVPELTISVINTTVVGAIQKFTFGSDANVGNKWLSHMFENVSGYNVPAIIAYSSELRGMYFNNANAHIDVDVEIYKNGVTATELIYTLEVRDSKWMLKTNMPIFTFVPGDQIRVYVKTVSGSANDALVELQFKIIADSSGELSGNN